MMKKIFDTVFGKISTKVSGDKIVGSNNPITKVKGSKNNINVDNRTIEMKKPVYPLSEQALHILREMADSKIERLFVIEESNIVLRFISDYDDDDHEINIVSESNLLNDFAILENNGYVEKHPSVPEISLHYTITPTGRLAVLEPPKCPHCGCILWNP